jgi:protein required for attachment to host cells
MDNIPPTLTRLAAEEGLRNQQVNLVDVIGQLVVLAKPQPEGDLRNKLFDRISELDVIAEVMRLALNSPI